MLGADQGHHAGFALFPDRGAFRQHFYDVRQPCAAQKAADPLEVYQGVPESGRHRDDAGAGPGHHQDLRKDWSKQLTGIAVLEAVAEDVTGEIEGVAIKANYDTFMDWLRQAALDEITSIFRRKAAIRWCLIWSEMRHGPDGPFPASGSGSDRRGVLQTPGGAGGRAGQCGFGHGKLNSPPNKEGDMAVLWAASSASPSLPSWPSRSSWKAPARDLPSSAAWAGTGPCSTSKLRSMCGRRGAEEGADGPERNERPDVQNGGRPRITKVGRFIRKTSIDELPQFLMFSAVP